MHVCKLMNLFFALMISRTISPVTTMHGSRIFLGVGWGGGGVSTDNSVCRGGGGLFFWIFIMWIFHTRYPLRSAYKLLTTDLLAITENIIGTNQKSLVYTDVYLLRTGHQVYKQKKYCRIVLNSLKQHFDWCHNNLLMKKVKRILWRNIFL